MIRKNLFLILLMLVVVQCSSSSSRGENIKLTRFKQGSLYGYKNSAGDVVIEADYMIAGDFQNQIAHVADRQKWMVINKQGKMLFTPFVFDNAPDAFREGLARFVQNDKIGYYDNTGKAVITAQYDFGEPFNKGRAKVCSGCRKVKSGEHYRYKGGKWFTIDARGKEYKEGN